MLNKPQEYICFSLSEDILRIVQVKGSGTTCKVGKIAAHSVAGLPEEELAKVVQGALTGFNTKAATVISVIPPGMTTTKNIEIPSVNPEEIKSIVSLQAGRHTPYSREEIQVGYISVGTSKANYTKVLLVIANRNVLKKQLSIFERSGLKVKKILFAPEGIGAFYGEVLGASEAPIGIIDIGKDATNFIISLKGIAITSRAIPIGKSQISAEGPAAIDKLTEEFKKTIEAYKSEDIDQEPQRFILTSEDEQSKAVMEAMVGKMKWNVTISSYVDAIKASQDVLRQMGTDFPDQSFLDLIAAAAMVDAAQVNLIPEEVQLQKSIEDQGKEIFKVAVLCLILLILVALTLGLKMFFKETFLHNLTDKYRQNREEVAELENVSIRTQLIQNYLQSRLVSLDTLDELYKSIPNEIYLTSITLDEEGNVSIQGISDIASLVFNLGTKLKESSFFKSVEIKSTTAKKDRGKDVSAFEITLRLSSADDSYDKTEETEKKAGE